MSYTVKSEGPHNAILAVVAEKGAAEEVRYGRPMVGPTGSLIREHLRIAGLNAGSGYANNIRDKGTESQDVFLTNAVHTFSNPGSNPTCADLISEQPRLYRELANLPNLRCVLACGAHALASLTNFRFCQTIALNGEPDTAIVSRRGSKYTTPFGIKLVAALHPAFYVRGEWRYKPVTQFDFNRAVREAAYPEIRTVPRDFHIRPTGLNEVLWYENEILQRPLSPYISFDIETFQGKNGAWYISCIGFSDHPKRAFCIPIMRRDRSSYWDISSEITIWRIIQRLLAQPSRIYVTQNGHAFDCWQLYKHRIATPYMANGFDTYTAHMLLAPDLPHDLGFLVSIYTEEAYYKDESGRNEKVPISDEQFWQYNCKDASLTLEVATGPNCSCREGLIRDLIEAGLYYECHIRLPTRNPTTMADLIRNATEGDAHRRPSVDTVAS
jgi:uracil-DNA glycosylase family 4